jgi:glycosyltransferase involved in cell wall biosynthesis
LVVPSRWYEGQPRAIVEAFAAGVPVIASNIGGLPELVENDVNGCLVDDVEGWTEALQRLAADDRVQRLGAGAYATWERRFTPEVALRELEDVYLAAVASAEQR